jgi:aspartokinase/homoserine dehydrogenase 1
LRNEFEAELARRDIDRIWSEGEVAIVAIVGPGVPHNPLIAARVFQALGSNGIGVNALSLGSSQNGISIVVSAESAGRATRQIHSELGLAEEATP